MIKIDQTDMPVNSPMLVSSSATESVALWNAATSYTVGQQARLATTQQIYENLIAGVDATSPDVAALVPVTPRWFAVGPSNIWAMFDGLITTKTSATSPLTVVVKPGYCNAIGFAGLEGELLTLVVRDGLAGPIVKTISKPLDGTVLTTLYEYIWEPFVQQKYVTVFELPPYIDAHVTVTVTGAGTVKIGMMQFGNAYWLGDTEFGATFSGEDYSDVTAFKGVTSIEVGPTRRRVDMRFMLGNELLNRLDAVMEKSKGRASFFVGTDVAGLEVLTVCGVVESYSAEVAYVNHSFCSIKLVGVF